MLPRTRYFDEIDCFATTRRKPAVVLPGLGLFTGLLILAGISMSQETAPAPPASPENTQASPAAVPPPGQAPLRATPTGLSPQNPEAVPASPGAPPQSNLPPQGGAMLPPQNSLPSPAPTVIQPEQIDGLPGTALSPERANARIIEKERPDRSQVYPDDPESAWWEINPIRAFRRAQREQKPLMLLFTGTWNAQSMSLSEEVFATKSFNEYVKENLVICYITYPKSSTDAAPWKRRIKEKFKVKGFPNVILFNPNGEVVRGVTGYRSGRPVDYFIELKNACQPVLNAIKDQKSQLAARGYRDWSNPVGKVIFARFLRRSEDQVTLQDISGQKWTIKLHDLAPDDQHLAESFPVSEEEDPPSH